MEGSDISVEELEGCSSVEASCISNNEEFEPYEFSLTEDQDHHLETSSTKREDNTSLIFDLDNDDAPVTVRNEEKCDVEESSDLNICAEEAMLVYLTDYNNQNYSNTVVQSSVYEENPKLPHSGRFDKISEPTPYTAGDVANFYRGSEESVVPSTLTEFEGTKVVVMLQGQSESLLTAPSHSYDRSDTQSDTTIKPHDDAPGNSPQVENKLNDAIFVQSARTDTETTLPISNSDQGLGESFNSDNSKLNYKVSSLGSVLFEKCNYNEKKSKQLASFHSDSTDDLEAANNSNQNFSVTILPECTNNLSRVPEMSSDSVTQTSLKSIECSSKHDNKEVQTPTNFETATHLENSSSTHIKSTPGRKKICFGECPSTESSALTRIEEHHPLHKQVASEYDQQVDESIKSEAVDTALVSRPSISKNSKSTYCDRKCKSVTNTRRRVSFAEDDASLITSYLEPVDPLERITSTINTEEILDAYRKSCIDHNASPIPRVVNQIQALPLNVSGRVESFTMKNFQLEPNHIEVLEEILKRVQFNSLNFECCSLTDETLLPLLEIIEYYRSTDSLNISNNPNIGSRGWQACCRMIKKSQSFSALEVREINVSDLQMHLMGKALKSTTKLHTLNLENCNMTGKPIVILTAALRDNNTLLKLYLGDNRLGPTDGLAILNLLRTNFILKLLDLRNNNLQDSGCAYICEGISEQSKPSNYLDSLTIISQQSRSIGKPGLESIVLYNNHITVHSTKHLTDMVISTKTLETLNIGRNSFGNDGIIRLKESLLRNKSIKRLYVQANKVSDEGAVALAEFIAESKGIQRIDLTENLNIKLAGLMALALSLKLNTSVVQLDLETNPQSETMPELIEEHINLLKEIKEYTHRNRVQVNMQDLKYGGKYDPNQLDPYSRKLSTETSELSNMFNGYSSIFKKNMEEHKKYRSPSPSPCSSPTPSISPSTPCHFGSKFLLRKGSDSFHPPISSGSAYTSDSHHYNNSLSVSECGLLSSSAPTCTIPTVATTSRPVERRNRFSSGGRFTVTKVSDSNLSTSLPDVKRKSCSLPLIMPTVMSSDSTPSSPKIVISSPVKIETGFGSQEDSYSFSDLNNFAIRNDKQNTQFPTWKCDSNDSDDFFIDSGQLGMSSSKSDHFNRNSEDNLKLQTCEDSQTIRGYIGASEEVSANKSDSSLQSSTIYELSTNMSKDPDRDSLFSNSSDKSIASVHSSWSSEIQDNLPACVATTSSPKKPSLLQSKKAPLASMETGSFDTDSDDSEVTTQSSDSTHSDEVRIAVADIVPKVAWASMAGKEEASNSVSPAQTSLIENFIPSQESSIENRHEEDLETCD